MAVKGRPDFRAIIVGGSVAGLTVAHAFEKAGIDFVLLEARDNIAPNLGASIVLFPNGATILDQLGIYGNMDPILSHLQYSTTWTDSGKLNPKTSYLGQVEFRLGYGCSVIERRPFLQSLYDQLKNKQSVHVDKRVNTVTQTGHGIVVKCQDGSEYHGDIVIGADGVRSTTRKEMQRCAAGDGKLMTKDTEVMTAEFDTVYGTSSPMPGFHPGEMHRSCAKGHSSLVFVGKDGRLFWGFMAKMDKKYSENSIPRRNASQSDAHIRKYPDFEVGCSTKLSELWKNVQATSFTALEEGLVENWSYGRIACVGDSVHKATINFGQGGNMAIESAASIANCIVKMLDTVPSTGVTDKQIEDAFQSYQNARFKRTKKINDFSNDLTREESYSTFYRKFLTVWVDPVVDEGYMGNILSRTLSHGPKLEYLPLPKARIQGNYQWELPKKIKYETKLRRALAGIPLLLACYGGAKTIGAVINKLLPLLAKASKASLFEVGEGTTIQMPVQIYRNGIDGLMKALVAFFLPAIAGTDPAQRLHGIAFLSDLSVLITICLIEGMRTGNNFTPAKLPFIALIMSQLKGAGIVMPIYYFIHYLTTPPRNFPATDDRMTNTAYAKTLLPALIAGFTFPCTVMIFYPDLTVRQYANGIWQLFPVWVSLTHRFLSYCVKDTTSHDRMTNPKADMPYLRNAYLLGGLTSASVYLYLWAKSPFSMKELFFSGLANPGEAVTNIAAGSGRFLKYDFLSTFGAGLYWTALQFWDLKRAQRTNVSWFKFLGTMAASTVSLGPGAAMAGFWYWREKMLGKKVVVKN